MLSDLVNVAEQSGHSVLGHGYTGVAKLSWRISFSLFLPGGFTALPGLGGLTDLVSLVGLGTWVDFVTLA